VVPEEPLHHKINLLRKKIPGKSHLKLSERLHNLFEIIAFPHLDQISSPSFSSAALSNELAEVESSRMTYPMTDLRCVVPADA
jgi:hypothetical protein